MGIFKGSAVNYGAEFFLLAPTLSKGTQLMFKQTLTAATVLTLVAGMAQAQALNSNDIAAVANASRTNEIRFNRDYKGRAFSDIMIFESASENPFTAGHYRLAFQSGKSTSFLGNGVDCKTSDQSVLNEVIDWNKGQRVSVTGTIRTTLMGDIQLDDCKLVKR